VNIDMKNPSLESGNRLEKLFGLTLSCDFQLAVTFSAGKPKKRSVDWLGKINKRRLMISTEKASILLLFSVMIGE